MGRQKTSIHVEDCDGEHVKTVQRVMNTTQTRRTAMYDGQERDVLTRRVYNTSEQPCRVEHYIVVP